MTTTIGYEIETDEFGRETKKRAISVAEAFGGDVEEMVNAGFLSDALEHADIILGG